MKRVLYFAFALVLTLYVTFILKRTTSFAFKEKIPTTVIMLYLDDTFNKEEVLMNFDELEVQNSLFNNYAFLS